MYATFAGNVGLCDNGGAYALPLRPEAVTSGRRAAVELGKFVDDLMDYAEANPQDIFRVEWDGFEVAEYAPAEIGKLFSMVSPNVHLPPELAPFCKGIRGPYGMKSG